MDTVLLFVMYVLMSVVIQPSWLPNPIKLIIIKRPYGRPGRLQDGYPSPRSLNTLPGFENYYCIVFEQIKRIMLSLVMAINFLSAELDCFYGLNSFDHCSFCAQRFLVFRYSFLVR